MAERRYDGLFLEDAIDLRSRTPPRSASADLAILPT